MANPIQLELVEPQPLPPPPTPPVMARSQITSEQVQALITLIASANPVLIVLPEGKSFADVKGFNVNVQPSGKGVVSIRF
jgi:hypothetical protein